MDLLHVSFTIWNEWQLSKMYIRRQLFHTVTGNLHSFCSVIYWELQSDLKPPYYHTSEREFTKALEHFWNCGINVCLSLQDCTYTVISGLLRLWLKFGIGHVQYMIQQTIGSSPINGLHTVSTVITVQFLLNYSNWIFSFTNEYQIK